MLRLGEAKAENCGMFRSHLPHVQKLNNEVVSDGYTVGSAWRHVDLLMGQRVVGAVCLASMDACQNPTVAVQPFVAGVLPTS